MSVFTSLMIVAKCDSRPDDVIFLFLRDKCPGFGFATAFMFGYYWIGWCILVVVFCIQ